MMGNLQIKAKRSWRTLILTFTVLVTCAANAQNITVSGTVTDETGPLPGVTALKVLIKVLPPILMDYIQLPMFRQMEYWFFLMLDLPPKE